jgi:hypothetical protein
VGVADISPGLAVFVFLFLFVVAVLWFFLPFAVFGIKDYLKRLEFEAKQANQRLEIIEQALQGRDRKKFPAD